MKLLTHKRPFKYGGYYYFDYQLLNYTEELAGSEYQALFSETVYQFTLIPKEKPEENWALFSTKWLMLIL